MWKETKAEIIVKELGIDSILNKELEDIIRKIEKNKRYFGKQKEKFLSKYLQSLSEYYASLSPPENRQKVENKLRSKGFKGDTQALLSLKVLDYIIQTAVGMGRLDKDMCGFVGNAYKEYEYFLSERKDLV